MALVVATEAELDGVTSLHLGGWMFAGDCVWEEGAEETTGGDDDSAGLIGR